MSEPTTRAQARRAERARRGQEAPQDRRERRHRGRGARRLAAVLVVVVVLGGGAAVAARPVDGALRGVAQDRVAEQVVRETGATGGVDVAIGGGWFVPQVLRGTYPSVRVDARGVPVPSEPSLRLEEVGADLRDVAVPLRSVLEGAPQVALASSRAVVRVAYPVLNGYLAGLERPLVVAPEAGGDRLHVTTTAEVLGEEVALSGWVVLEVADGDGGGAELRAVPDELDLDDGLVDDLSRSVLRRVSGQLAFTVPLAELPLDLQVTGAQVRSTGVELTTEGGAATLVG